MKKTKVNWEKVWKSFNRWFDYKAKDYMWETQSKKIEQIVERQLKRK